jgi:hypothetical protein
MYCFIKYMKIGYKLVSLDLETISYNTIFTTVNKLIPLIYFNLSYEKLTEISSMTTILQAISPRVILLILLFSSQFISASFANEIEDCEEDVFSIYCPQNAYLDCNDEIWDLSWLGNAYYHDYTGTHDAGYPEVKYHLNDCNIGYITRTWKVADYNNVWHKCTQYVYVDGNYFNSSTIDWPDNIELTGCNPPTKPYQLPKGYDIPTWSNYGASCSKIGTNYHDNVYVYGPGCYEIIRTWSLVDCCNFNPYYNQGIWTYNQRITVTTTGYTPSVWVPYDVQAETTNCEKVYVDIPALEVKDGCEDQYIISNNSPYASYDGANASGKYPVGVTEVRFMVKYNCWETKFYYVNVTVLDNSHPTPYCYYGLAVPLMGVDTDDDGEVDDGMFELWASDLDAGSFHPCRPDETLKLSFSSDPYDNVRVFTCEDIGEKELEIWVTDETGKQDYCGTYVDIQNNAANIPNCEPIMAASISGVISSVFNNTEDLMLDINSSFEGMEFDTTYIIEQNVSILDSTVNENGQISYHYGIEEISTPIFDTTHVNKDFEIEVQEGEYFLADLDLNEDYELTIINSKETAVNIDTMDVHLLAAYLNDEYDLDAFQMMAADLNHDLMVDESDLNILSAFVEGGLSEEEIDLSWVTFDPTYEMDSNGNTDISDYPNSRMVEIKNRNASGIDLLLFQMGDLTNETDLNSLIGGSLAEHRDLSQFKIKSIQPNPFTDESTFHIYNDKKQNIGIELFDIKGGKITSMKYVLDKGHHSIKLNGGHFDRSGIYFYVISSETSIHQGKLVHIK